MSSRGTTGVGTLQVIVSKAGMALAACLSQDRLGQVHPTPAFLDSKAATLNRQDQRNQAELLRSETSDLPHQLHWYVKRKSGLPAAHGRQAS